MPDTPDGLRPPSPQPVRLSGAPVVLFLLAATSCSRDRDEIPRPDTTPPAKVNDLAARALSDSTILLTWTAPGDDGMEGTAKRYDFRFNTEPFPAQGHFPVSYPPVPETPPPASGGTPETLLVGGLTHSTTYHFGMRVLDEMENLSPVSNLASATTADTLYVDNFPPAIVADIEVQRLDLAFYRFTFTVPGDDGMVGQATAFDVRWSREPLVGNDWDTATPVDPYATPTVPGRRQTIEVKFPTGLEDGYTVISAVDKGGNRSPPHEPILLPGLTPRTWYVNIEGTGDAPTIQAALDMAGPGDEVLVGPGNYHLHLELPPWEVSFRSTHGASFTQLSPVAAQKPILTTRGAAHAIWTIEGFTFRNGQSTSGAAILCAERGTPKIRECRFVENNGHSGPAITIATVNHPASRESVVIENNEFIGNEATGNGGAIYIVVPERGQSQFILRNNRFVMNRCRLDGGAVFIADGDNGGTQVLDSIFENNYAGDHGGALYLASDNSFVAVERNLFSLNRADGARPGNTGSGGGVNVSRAFGRIRWNTFFANEGLTETGGGGGALEIEYVEAERGGAELHIRDNVFAYSRGGVFLFNHVDDLVRIGRNLMWANDDIEALVINGSLPSAWDGHLLRLDPLFCNPMAGDLRLSAQSPALEGKEVMGAFDEPGCP